MRLMFSIFLDSRHSEQGHVWWKAGSEPAAAALAYAWQAGNSN